MPILEIASAVLGIGGGLVQRWLQARETREKAEFDLKAQQARQSFDLAMRDKDHQYMLAEAANAIALAEVNAAKERDVAGYQALTASYAADRATYSSERELSGGQLWLLVLVDFARGITRPGLSWLLVAFLGWLLWSLPAASDELQTVIDSVRALASTAVGWWFASRQSTGPGGKRGA
ncbi:MAG: hypothetical protein MUC68_00265 [Burkholderiaceae bacterium]|jgi:hypothetical protein|nr:hypothetical protein [Burkholderiaceae bacterium]